MAKILKPGRAVIILRGRYAGKKAVVLRNFDDTNEKHYGVAIVAIVTKSPAKVTKAAKGRRLQRLLRIGSTVKLYNQSHLLPTRFLVELDKSAKDVSLEAVRDPTVKDQSNKAVHSLLKDRFESGKVKWLFQPLRF